MDNSALRHHVHKILLELRNITPVHRAAQDDAPPAYTPCTVANERVVDVGRHQRDQEDEKECTDESESDDGYDSDDDHDERGEDGSENRDELVCHSGDEHHSQGNPIHARRPLKSAVPPQSTLSQWDGDAVAKAVRAIQQQNTNAGTLPSTVPRTDTNTITITARTTIHGNNNLLTPDFSLIGARLAHALATRLVGPDSESPPDIARMEIPGVRCGSLQIKVDCGIDIFGNGNVVGMSIAAPPTTIATTSPGGSTTAPDSAAKLPSAGLRLNASKSEYMPCSCQPARAEVSEVAGAFGNTSCHASSPANFESSCPNGANTNVEAEAREADTGAGECSKCRETARCKRAREESDCDEHGTPAFDDLDTHRDPRRKRRCREGGGAGALGKV